MDAKTIRRIKAAKNEVCPDLKKQGWRLMDTIRTFTVTPAEVCARDKIERIDGRTISEAQFLECYESVYKPVVILNVQDGWPANEKWTVERLGQKYGNKRFRCGYDKVGPDVRIKMKYYVQYMHNNDDDCPLYMFDHDFAQRRKQSRLLHDYIVPKMFRDDLFRFADKERRPPYRWIAIGPARSGSNIHMDPLGTSAWNALVVGHKWWCLIPNKCPKYMLEVSPKDAGPIGCKGIAWFMFVYPKTQQPDWPQEFKPIEILQSPGETVFVPGGWWHAVVNLDDTIAVTQNFCSVCNFPVVWHKTVRHRPVLARTWMKKIREVRPELAAIAASVDLYAPTVVLSDSTSTSSSSGSSRSTASSSASSSSRSKSENEIAAAGALGAVGNKSKPVIGDQCQSNVNASNSPTKKVDSSPSRPSVSKRRSSPRRRRHGASIPWTP